MLAKLEEMEVRDRRNSARFRLHMSARTSSGAGEGLAIVLNISAKGFLVNCAIPVAVGEKIEIKLPNLDIRSAVVMRLDDEFAGCEFDEPITEEELSAALLDRENWANPPSARQDAA